MGCPKRAAAHIGRIGTLAISLGIGTAVITGSGTAWADTTDVGPGGPGTSTQQSTSAPTAARAGRGSGSGAHPPHSAGSSAGNQGGSGKGGSSSGSGSASTAAAPAAVTSPVSQSVSRIHARQTAVAVAGTTVPPAAPAPVAVSPVTPPVASPVAVAVPAAAVLQAPHQPVAAAQTVTSPVRGLASRLLAVVDQTAPGNPTESPALWALLAWTRRDLGSASARSVATRAAAATAQANASVTAAAVTPPTSLGSLPIGWVTGQRNTAYPGSGWTQTNNTSWANVYGTDVGVMWFNGENGKTQLAFGDTFSGPNMTGNWRSNVLLLSTDTRLYDGLTLQNTGPAYQFIPAARNQVFFIGSEVTNIPSSAVYANGQNYVNYFSVKSWDTPGRWTTNYSAISMFNTTNNKWELQPSTVRSAGWFRSSTPYRAGDQNFQQMAYVLQPESKVTPGGPRYVYAFGTPSGRAGSAFLSRVPESAITDLGQYEYWDGGSWVRNKPAVAAPVIGDSPNSAGLFGFVRDIANNPNFFGGWFAGLVGAKTGGNVSEMSVQYNDYLGKYVVMYGNGANNVILRTADTPEGPWSDPVTVATSIQYPGLYAPMIHPLSGTGQLTDSGGNPDVSNLYWNMSLWGNYNVVLMKTDLTTLKTSLV